MKIKKCPRCKSTRIVLEAGFITGNYHCRKCGYIGPIVLEEDIQIEKSKTNT